MAQFPRLSVSQLANGIHVISSPNRMQNVSGTGFRVGSAYDPVGRRGMNHLTEHGLAQQSTIHSGRDMDLLVFRLMGGYDGDVNIRVDRTSTFFGHDDLYSRRDMHEAFDAFAQMIFDGIQDARGRLERPLLDGDGLDTEKSAVHNEYRLRGTDLPESEITDALYSAMWERNPIKNRIDCEPHELKKITLSELKRFVRRWYSTGRMFTVFMGLDHAEARRKTEKYYGSLKETHPIEPRWEEFDRVPRLEGIRHVELVHPGARQHHVALGFPTRAYMSPDDEAIDILSSVWEFRLFQKLRAQNRSFDGGVYRAGALTDRSFLHGILYSWFATVGSFDYAMELAQVAERECDNLKRRKLSKAEHHDLQVEIETMRGMLRRKFMGAFKWYPGVSSELVINSFCNGDNTLEHLVAYPSRLDAVTCSSVQKAAEDYMTVPDRMVRVVLKPLTVPSDIYQRAIGAVPELEEYLKFFRPTS